MQLLTPDLGLLLWTLLAFLVVLFILGKYAWPAIVKGLNDREKNIADSIASAEKVKLEMAQLKNDNESLLAPREQCHRKQPAHLTQVRGVTVKACGKSARIAAETSPSANPTRSKVISHVQTAGSSGLAVGGRPVRACG
jgi:F-type H+-transporting ATPase subunit b